jgi:hypothetical protein
MKYTRILCLLAAGTFGAVESTGLAEEPVGARLTPQAVPTAPSYQTNTLPWESAPAAEGFCPAVENDDWIEAGHLSAQLMAGYYAMSSLGSDGIPFRIGPDGKPLPHHHFRFDYVPLALRLGWAPCPVLCDETWLRGSGEVLFEYTANPVVRQFGHFVTGPSLLLRYNFQQKACRLVPYLQGGAGYVLNDAYHKEEQRLIGGPTEFLLQAELGVRYFVSSSWSLDAEGGYQHISNANTFSRNVGVNNFGGSIGFTYHFGRGCR